MTLGPHQDEKANELLQVLQQYKIAYLRGEVRSGKTITALETAKRFGAISVLFLTKKKATGSILKDYDTMGYTYALNVTNYEALHKVVGKYCLIIYDEAHVLGAFPKPAKRTKKIGSMFSHLPCILMSGTPAAESYSQFYHQFYISEFSPFDHFKYPNFYKWAKEFVNVKQKRLGTHTVNDYSDAYTNLIEKVIAPYCVTMTQEDAGISTSISENILFVDTPIPLYNMAKRLIDERAIEGKKGFIMAESPAKLQSKVHQIYNGTVIYEDHDGNNKSLILSTYKADFIKEQFKGKKIAVMYYYQAELDVLKQVFGDAITTDLNVFNTTGKHFAIQQSSTEGMNISKADCLVYYNFHFSGKNYIQSRDRLTVKDRLNNDVYFIIEKDGINHEILKRVREKKDFNIGCFNRKFLKEKAI